MEPLKTGMTWTLALADSRVRTITNVTADITLPYGNFQPIEDKYSSNSLQGEMIMADQNIGIIKSIRGSVIEVIFRDELPGINNKLLAGENQEIRCT